MAAVKFSVEVSGFKQMMKRLKPAEDLYAEPVQGAMNDIADLGEALGIRAAPLKSGRTIGGFERKVQKKKVPLWAVVKTTAKDKHGFAFTRVVNYSPFAQSRYRKGVNRHRNWFDNAMNQARGAMGKILEKAGDEIERRWTQ
jgi:hypothetical protein